MFGTNAVTGQKWFKDAKPETLFVTSMFSTLQGEGPFAGKPALFIRLAKCNLTCSFCFISSTMITMADGTLQEINTINVGDEVLSWDGFKFVPKKVTKTHQSNTRVLSRVRIDGVNTFATPDHPFLKTDGSWVLAKDLNEGDLIKGQSGDGKVEQVEMCIEPNDSIVWECLFNSNEVDGTVYNIEVEDTSTYIANGMVVHNCDTFFDDGDWMSFDEIDEMIDATIQSRWTDKGLDVPEWVNSNNGKKYANHVLVMTGGEPLLQGNIVQFLERQLSVFGNVQIESNGTVNQAIPDGVTLVCSPKCIEKDGIAIRYLSPSKLILERADCLKFVMCADAGSPYNEVPDWAHEWKRNNYNKELFISPMNVYNTYPQQIKLLRADDQSTITLEQRSTVDEVINFFEPGLLNMDAIKSNHEYVGNYCMEYGYRMQMQMHLFANLA